MIQLESIRDALVSIPVAPKQTDGEVALQAASNDVPTPPRTVRSTPESWSSCTTSDLDLCSLSMVVNNRIGGPPQFTKLSGNVDVVPQALPISLLASPCVDEDASNWTFCLIRAERVARRVVAERYEWAILRALRSDDCSRLSVLSDDAYYCVVRTLVWSYTVELAHMSSEYQKQMQSKEPATSTEELELRSVRAQDIRNTMRQARESARLVQYRRARTQWTDDLVRRQRSARRGRHNSY